MLTIVTFLWRGWRPLYAAENVNALQRMLAQHLKQPHRLICVTDTPHGIECETMPNWKMPEIKVRPKYPDCYRRLKLFSLDAMKLFGDRILSLDLDCVILKDIDPLITDHEFRIVDGFSCPYNGSMWLLKTGTRTKAWDKFIPETSPEEAAKRQLPDGRRYLGSDQSWLSHILPGEETWKNVDGVYLFHGKSKTEALLTIPRARIIFFPGHHKPWGPRIQAKYPAIHEAYMRYMR